MATTVIHLRSQGEIALAMPYADVIAAIKGVEGNRGDTLLELRSTDGPYLIRLSEIVLVSAKSS